MEDLQTGGQAQWAKSAVMCKLRPELQKHANKRMWAERQQPGNLNDSQPKYGASKCSLPEIYVSIDLPRSFLLVSSYSLATPPSHSLPEEIETQLAAGDISEKRGLVISVIPGLCCRSTVHLSSQLSIVGM